MSIKKRPTCFVVISSIKLRRFWWNFVDCFLNQFAAKDKTFSTSPEKCLYTTLWNLKCSSRTSYHWVVREKNLHNLSHLTVAPRAPNSPDLNLRDYSVWKILQEKVYKTLITDLDEIKQPMRTVGQGGSRHHCGSHSSMASPIGPDQWCVFCSLYIFSRSTIFRTM